jgi:hypothetical protein
MKLKRGVKLNSLTPQIVIALMVAQEEYAKVGTEMVITSANDSTHRAGSDHYFGRAVDLRTRNLYKVHDKHGLAKSIHDNLGNRFVCIFEGEGTPNEHIHLAWRGV